MIASKLSDTDKRLILMKSKEKLFDECSDLLTDESILEASIFLSDNIRLMKYIDQMMEDIHEAWAPESVEFDEEEYEALFL